MKNYLLSIAVAVYNNEKYLDICIKSLVASKGFENYQIILVDDGSSDRSDEIIQRYKKYKNIFNVRHPKNLGIVHARRTGFNVSTAPYIAFIDGDDFVSHLHFAHLLKKALQNNADIVCDGYTEFHERNLCKEYNNAIKAGFYNNNDLMQLKHVLIMSEYQNIFNIFSYVWCKIFKRELVSNVIEEIPGDVFLGEDACLTYPCVMNSSSILVCELNGYHYRQHEVSSVKSSLARSVEVDKLKNLWIWLKKFSNQHKNFNLDVQIRKYISSLIIVRIDFINNDNNYVNLIPDFKLDVADDLVVVGGGTFSKKIYSWLKSRYSEKNITHFKYIDYFSNNKLSALGGLSNLTKYLICYMRADDCKSAFNGLCEAGVNKGNIEILDANYIFNVNELENIFPR